MRVLLPGIPRLVVDLPGLDLDGDGLLFDVLGLVDWIGLDTVDGASGGLWAERR